MKGKFRFPQIGGIKMKGKIFFFGVCLLLGVVLSLPSFAATSLSTDENKTIAASFLKNAMLIVMGLMR